MKTLRFFSALFIASALAAPFVSAEDTKKEQPAGCDCAKDKNGKVCGVDKDCCCTGKKCEKPAEEKKS